MTSNNESTPQQPQVSSLPIPVPDTPLVIDLPDGQKLVVGNLAPGSVIEVATWRGTGRPDSRTSRLMLGMSTPGSENSAKQEPEQEPAKLTGGALFWDRTKAVFSFLTGIGENKQARIKSAKPKNPKQSGRRSIQQKPPLEKNKPLNDDSSTEISSSTDEKLKAPVSLLSGEVTPKLGTSTAPVKQQENPKTSIPKTPPRVPTSARITAPKQGETPDYDAGIDAEIESFWAKYKK